MKLPVAEAMMDAFEHQIAKDQIRLIVEGFIDMGYRIKAKLEAAGWAEEAKYQQQSIDILEKPWQQQNTATSSTSRQRRDDPLSTSE